MQEDGEDDASLASDTVYSFISKIALTRRLRSYFDLKAATG